MITREQFNDSILPITLKHEGGYVNDPYDKGGETYRGISRVANPNWQGWQYLERWKPLMRGDIVNDRELKKEVQNLYWSKYFEGCKFQNLNSPLVALICFDWSVNGGYKVHKLQTIANGLGCSLIVDNVIGAKTIEALNSLPVNKLCHAILDERKAHYERIVERNPKQERFMEGWLNRLLYFRKLINKNEQ